MPKESKDLTIAQVIHAVRQQLIQAEEMRINSGMESLFTVGYLDLKLKVAVKRSDSASGKIGFTVLGIGTDVSECTEVIHTVSLHLDSVLRKPAPLPVHENSRPAVPFGLLQSDVKQQDK